MRMPRWQSRRTRIAIDLPRKISAGDNGGSMLSNGVTLCARHAHIASDAQSCGFILYCAAWYLMAFTMRPCTFSTIPFDFGDPGEIVNFAMQSRFAISRHSSLSIFDALSDSRALGTPNLAMTSCRNMSAAWRAVMSFLIGLQIR